MTADKLASAISFALKPAVFSRTQELGEAISREDSVTKAVDLVCQVVSPAIELASSTGA